MCKALPIGLKNPAAINGYKTRAIAVAIAALGVAVNVNAQVIDTGNSDVSLNWTNTVGYMSAWRTENPSAKIAVSNAVQPNIDYGDRALEKGMINNRFDLLSELDFRYANNFGFRLSGAAWYDSVYDKDRNDYPNDGFHAPNSISAATGGANNINSDALQRLMGKNAEIRDAFVFGGFDIGDQKVTLRAGQHTVIFGETLFLGANGIASAQGPVDLIKAFSQPNAQFKEIALPVKQLSATWQISPAFSLSGYYQFEWEPLRLPASGSFFNPADFVGAGADLLLTPAGAASRGADLKGSNSGQLGLQAKFKYRNTDYGLYAGLYDDKSPIPVVDFTKAGSLGGPTYNLAYAKDITFYGASFSTVLGESNVAGEISTRRNTPLVPLGDLILNTASTWDNDRNTPYALGNTLHANLSTISVFPATSLWQGASLVTELAFNRLLSVDRNPVNALGISALNTTHTRDSTVIRFVFQPEYFQVLPGLDLQVPVGVGYGIDGRSPVLQLIPEHGGDLTIGLKADYKKTWKAGFNMTHYYGSEGPPPSLDPATNSYASYKQYYGDRDFIALTIQRTF